MKHSTLSLAGLLLILVLASCKSKTEKPEGPDPEKLENVTGFIDLTNCDNLEDNSYCARGFDFIQLGDSLVWKDLYVDGASVKDTVYNQYDPSTGDTTSWNVKLVNFDDGQVILESEFTTFEYLGRIRIETPRFKNVHGIGVGSTYGDLKKNYTNFQFLSYPEMEVAEIMFKDVPGVFFQVKDPGGKYLDPNKEEYSDDDIPDDAEIIRVVLWDRTL